MLTSKSLFAALVVFPGLAFPAAAQAADCAPLKLLGVAPLQALPGSDRMMVPVTINGQRLNLLLDTGSGASSLTGAAGRKLGLDAHYDPGRLLDANGYASVHYF